jgi:hypothetical protein
MCNTTIQNTNFISNGSNFDLEVTGSSTNCEYVKINIICQTHNFDSPVIQVSGNTWSHIFSNIPCNCDEFITVTVCCTDKLGTPLNNCECDDQRIIFDCSQNEPDQCCPIVTHDIAIGECNNNCEREIVITTAFDNPISGCPPATLQWQLFSNGNIIYQGTPIVTALNSPTIESIWIDPINSPIQAQLTIVYPDNCTNIIDTIILPPCISAANCPTINTFEHEFIGCEVIGNNCCQKVEFNINAEIFNGCNGSDNTEITINFGDGSNPEIRTLSYSGLQQIVFDHHYCDPGNYTATLSVNNPSGCSTQSININIVQCPLEPPVCPEISLVSVEYGECDDDCKREVEIRFTTENVNPCSQNPSFHIEWGDGNTHPNNGQSIQIPTGPYTHVYSHYLESGTNHEIKVIFDNPNNCDDLIIPVEPPICENCEECEEDKWWKRILCPILKVLAIIGEGAVIFGLLIIFLSSCINGLPVDIATTSLIIGLAAILLYVLICKCKKCGYLYLVLIRPLIGLGISGLLFGGCCSNLITYGLIFLAIGLFLLYLRTKKCCTNPNSYWCCFLSPLAIAFTWAGTIYGYLQSAFSSQTQNCQVIWGSVNVTQIVLIVMGLVITYTIANCVNDD